MSKRWSIQRAETGIDIDIKSQWSRFDFLAHASSGPTPANQCDGDVWMRALSSCRRNAGTRSVARDDSTLTVWVPLDQEETDESDSPSAFRVCQKMSVKVETWHDGRDGCMTSRPSATIPNADFLQPRQGTEEAVFCEAGWNMLCSIAGGCVGNGNARRDQWTIHLHCEFDSAACNQGGVQPTII